MKMKRFVSTAGTAGLVLAFVFLAGCASLTGGKKLGSLTITDIPAEYEGGIVTPKLYAGITTNAHIANGSVVALPAGLFGFLRPAASREQRPGGFWVKPESPVGGRFLDGGATLHLYSKMPVGTHQVATGTAIGTGQANTTTLVGLGSAYEAACAAVAHRGGGLEVFFPSRLQEIYSLGLRSDRTGGGDKL